MSAVVRVAACKRGHPQTPSNLDSRFRCRPCLRVHGARYYAKRPEAVIQHGRDWANARYVERRALLDSLKDVPCVDCGVGYPGEPDLMQFDHRDPADKVFVVSQMTSLSEDRILEEAAKCDVVCVVCHIRRTRVQRSAGVFSGRPRKAGV